MLSVAALTLRQSRRATVGWLAGTAATGALYGSSYHSVSGAKSAAIANYPPSLRRALNLTDLTSPAGYLASTVFGIPMLLLVSVYVIGAGTRAVAGDEESGVLALLLAHPVTRTDLVLARMASIVVVLAGMGLVLFVVVLIVRGPAGLSVSAVNLAATTSMLVLLGGCLGAIVLFVSASLGRRSTTLGLSAGLLLTLYLAGSFLPIVADLAWTREISPYYWFSTGEPLRHGLQLRYCLLMLATTAAATALAVSALNRRDLRG